MNVIKQKNKDRKPNGTLRFLGLKGVLGMDRKRWFFSFCRINVKGVEFSKDLSNSMYANPRPYSIIIKFLPINVEFEMFALPLVGQHSI